MEANLNVVSDRIMPALEKMNERAISLQEVFEAVNEMNSGKALGLYGFTVKCLKKWGMTVL